ncbi:MAG: dockerin type I repeat-containing protein [Ruminococcus sp.]|nr:dockerin type I repeat-containing protein [Ruminococcus sp.]
MKRLRILSVFIVVLLILSVPVSVFAAPLHDEYFENTDEMQAWIDDYSKTYPNVQYSYGGLTVPSKGYELKHKDFIVVTIDNPDYTMDFLSCGESRYNYGIDHTYSSYVKNNGYTDIGIQVYYDLTEDVVIASLDRLESNPNDGALYTGEISGYRYVVCDIGWDDGSTDCTYKIAVDDVLINIHSNSAFDRALLENLVIKKSGTKLPVLVKLPEEIIAVSDELLEAVKVDYNNDSITKEDIHISDLETIDETKKLVRFSVSNYGYTCDEVEQQIGDYILYVPQRPLPNILKDGVLYDIDDAYEKGIISDADLEIISTFESRSYSLNKVEDLYGDADGDKMITIFDATAVQRYVSKKGGILGKYSQFADFDRDGEITIFDATAIQRKIAGL